MKIESNVLYNRKYKNLPYIPMDIQDQLDEYIGGLIIPLLEAGESTPIVEPKYWDLIIIMQCTGLRFQEILHFIAAHEDSSMECLQYDLDENYQPYLNYRTFKNSIKSIGMTFEKFSVSHILDSSGRKIVERAVLRQKERVKGLPPTSDGYYYLFREVTAQSDSVSTLISLTKLNTILKKIAEEIPLIDYDGTVYQIFANQFRATIIKERLVEETAHNAFKDLLSQLSKNSIL